MSFHHIWWIAQPDIFRWNDDLKVLTVFESTIPFENNIHTTSWYKHGKYSDSKQHKVDIGYKSNLWPWEWAHEGWLTHQVLLSWRNFYKLTRKRLTFYFWNVKDAIKGSYSIWCCFYYLYFCHCIAFVSVPLRTWGWHNVLSNIWAKWPWNPYISLHPLSFCLCIHSLFDAM